MITKQILMDLSREFSLPVNTVEKDYVLGWLLAGIANDNELFNKWIFKGGTCLKKCYFETYRFSEDLDYTLTDANHINEKFLIDHFQSIGEWIYEMSGIKIIENSIRFDIYKNRNGKTTVEGRLNYVGPLQRQNNPYRIKLDLTAEELLVLPPTLQDVHHPYPDLPSNGIKAYCYNFSEVFAEKIRALSERARPRDLYDVVHLHRHAIIKEKPSTISEILKRKCEYKSIPMPTLDLLQTHAKLSELENEWENMLAHQLPILPEKEHFWKNLPEIFDWLNGNNKTLAKSPIPFTSKENLNSAWKAPKMTYPWGLTIPLELVRYAGANHLCIKLVYENENYLVEPYDLRKTSDEILLLIAINHITGEKYSFKAHLIQQAEITKTSFDPRYQITMTPY